MSDFIPTKDADFNLFQGSIISIVTPNANAWGILAADLTALTPLQTLWNNAFAKASNKLNRTSADVQTKNDARKLYEKAIRNFIAQWIAKNPKVPDSERERMGLTLKDTKLKKAVQVNAIPIGVVDFSIRLQHTINFSDANSPRSKAKPDGMNGCEIWMKLGGDAPKEASELSYVATDTRTPYVIQFSGADAGKTAYYWLRWISNTGKPCPWSQPVSALVVG
ncbi:MAG: hypothetical protein WCK02_11865 [Bacteroidota bacterium]